MERAAAAGVELAAIHSLAIAAGEGELEELVAYSAAAAAGDLLGLMQILNRAELVGDLAAAAAVL